MRVQDPSESVAPGAAGGLLPEARPGLARFAAPLAAALVAVFLIGGAVMMQRQIDAASSAVVRGQGDSLASAVRTQWREGLVDDASLARFVNESDAGVRYVAVVVAPDRVLARAGVEQGQGVTISEPTPLPRGLRTVRGLPSRAPGEKAVVVLEFEPTVASELQSQARTLVVSSVLGAAWMLVLTALLYRAAAARSRLLVDVQRHRQLAALGEMSAVLAHEIKNPLASIKGHAQLLVEQLAAKIGADSREHQKAERVVAEAVRLEHLLDELMGFMKTGAVNLTQVEPAALLVEAAADAGVALSDIDPVPACSLDAALMRQALGNLLKNALQASPPDRGPEATCGLDGGDVVFTVRDHGDGISAEAFPRLFEPFFTTRTRGTGLGLTIARRIVEMHGGTITASNVADGGARFTLRVPVQASGALNRSIRADALGRTAQRHSMGGS